MSIAISNALSVTSLAASNTAPNATPPQPAEQPAPQDSVTLTEAQQVYQLYNQGQTVPQIATALSLSMELVNNYLGISTSS